MRIGTSQFERFGATGNVGNSGDLLQVEFEGFVDEKFVEASVFAEYEGIVETGDQKDVVDFEGHQVFEAFKALFGVEDGLGDAREDHERSFLNAGEKPALKKYHHRVPTTMIQAPARTPFAQAAAIATIDTGKSMMFKITHRIPRNWSCCGST